MKATETKVFKKMEFYNIFLILVILFLGVVATATLVFACAKLFELAATNVRATPAQMALPFFFIAYFWILFSAIRYLIQLSAGLTDRLYSLRMVDELNDDQIRNFAELMKVQGAGSIEFKSESKFSGLKLGA